MQMLELFELPIGQHGVLNPKLWEARGVLKNEVRGALLRIAEDFEDFCNVDIVIKDIVITGGNANYTYTGHSDIDLHIIADLSDVDCDREINELFDTKRLLYKEYRDISIHKIPVELYVEDLARPAVSGGCYSILTNKWIKEPLKNIPKFDQPRVKEIVDHWHTVILQAAKTRDEDSARRVMSLLKQYRRRGLDTPAGEFSTANLVFKSLRNDDSVRQLQHILDIAHDRRLSV